MTLSTESHNEKRTGAAVSRSRLLNLVPAFSHRERLAEAAACLQRIDDERDSAGDPTFGKVLEERIVWRELRDLELQEFDEQTSLDHARLFLARFDTPVALS